MNPAAVERDTRQILYFIAALVLVRAIVAAYLPLAFDEAYYWLWSKTLAAGYYDHPPLIAYLIRAGTLIFGDSEFGVRFLPFVLSIAASWAVWRAGVILLGSDYLGALAALLYNLTLMVNAEALVATPDAPAMAASAFFLLALTKVATERRGEWWLAVGAAGGVALLSKYTALFLGASAFLWLVAAPDGRRWLLSAWPYLGAALALSMFAPVLLWNAEHGWVSLARQFGRTAVEGFTLRYLGEFLAGQAALATPFILVLGIAVIARITFIREYWRSPLSLLAALAAPAILYFVGHSLHGRVQGNWPSFLYPAISIAAAATWDRSGAGKVGRVLQLSRFAAVPTAVFFVLVTYAHSLWGILPLARDPIVRLLAVGYAPLAQQIEELRVREDARAILTTSYAQTGWLTFYLPSGMPVVQANEPERWPPESRPWPEDVEGPYLYVTESWRDQVTAIAAQYGRAERLAMLSRNWKGNSVEDYTIYRVGPAN